jgi:hypothetical protein
MILGVKVRLLGVNLKSLGEALKIAARKLGFFYGMGLLVILKRRG